MALAAGRRHASRKHSELARGRTRESLTQISRLPSGGVLVCGLCYHEGIFSRGRDARAGIREWECGRRAVRLRYGTTFISTIVKWLTLFFRFMASNSGETTSRQEAENVTGTMVWIKRRDSAASGRDRGYDHDVGGCSDSAERFGCTDPS